ncbi:MAG: type II toxin-antitoxin system VapC family toxin [Azoarcus sp.]|jgi:predicted nucleic acid-binding protein|nr:type II toxin-antitoxin system VapC family toxin [Azoarcus sp.]
MYLLDTNVISELRKNRPHGAVLAWLKFVPNKKVHLCAATLGEIQTGVERTREQDAAKAADIEAWADLVATRFNVIPMDAEAFRLCAKLMHRRTNALYIDAMIAACALQHGLTVVTRNVRDFIPFGVALLNPFEYAAQHEAENKNEKP